MHLPQEFAESRRLSIWNMTCADPRSLTIGCKNMHGTIAIEMEGVPLAISSTADGHTIVITDSIEHAAATSPVGIATLTMVDIQADRLNKAVALAR